VCYRKRGGKKGEACVLLKKKEKRRWVSRTKKPNPLCTLGEKGGRKKKGRGILERVGLIRDENQRVVRG